MDDKLRNWIQIIALVVTMVISGAIFVSSRPSRDEVDKMIETRTVQRFDRLEKQNDIIQQDIKEILKRLPAK